MSFKIRVGASRIITVTWPKEFTIEEAQRAIDDLTKTIAGLTYYPVAIVSDMTQVGLKAAMSPKLARIAAAFITSNRPMLSQRVVGWADVSSSPFFRGIARGLGLKIDRPYAWDMFETVEEAERWGARQIVQQGR